MAVNTSDFVVYLAGPVIDEGTWRKECIECFMEIARTEWPDSLYEILIPRIKFVVPCFWLESHPLSRFFARYCEEIKEEEKPSNGDDISDWELHHLTQIFEHLLGVVVIGLFPEIKLNKDEECSLYTMNTMCLFEEIFSFGKDGFNNEFIVGSQPEFLGLSRLEERMEREWGSDYCNSVYKGAVTPRKLADSIASLIITKSKSL